jgi:hypothetical protein
MIWASLIVLMRLSGLDGSDTFGVDDDAGTEEAAEGGVADAEETC